MRILVLGAGADSGGGLGVSATSALLALKAGGAQVVLLDSNPATLATDLDVAHRTYLEPVTLEAAARVLALEQPDAVLPTLAGESALALARTLVSEGVLAKSGAHLLGVTVDGLAFPEPPWLGDVQGWRQAELLVLRDGRGAAQVAASVEFFEPMGVHPLDSVAVTPAQSFETVTLKQMQGIALKVAGEVGVVGLCGVSLAIDPATGEVRFAGLTLSLPRQVALVTKATGRELAAEAAGLVLGGRLTVSASVQAGLAIRAPRFDSERFGAVAELGPEARSVGEVLTMGGSLGEALLKALHALDVVLEFGGAAPQGTSPNRWHRALLGAPSPYAPLILEQLKTVREVAERFATRSELDADALWAAKAQGFSDAQLAQLRRTSEEQVRTLRRSLGVRASLRSFGTVSTLSWDSAARPPPQLPCLLLLGGGPRRIGQGSELDWSCVHAARALRSAGSRVVLLDSTPEVWTAGFDQVCLGALSREDVLELSALLAPAGVLTQFGGGAALALSGVGAPALGAPPAPLDRVTLGRVAQALGLATATGGVAASLKEAKAIAIELGYPLIARTAAGTSMIHSEAELVPGHLERFFAEATEADVELLRDAGGKVVVAGVLEHVEQAGIHSGDAACTLPPHSLSAEVVERLKDAASALAGALKVVGLLSVRFAVQGKSVYVLEVSPRVSRSVPFVAKATGLQLVELAARLALGATLEQLGCTHEPAPRHVAVKEAVFPFARFPEADVLLGAQMKSTGEVMGLSESLAVAFGKSQLAAGTALPRRGRVFLSVQDDDKPAVVDLGKRLVSLGFSLLTTDGTWAYLQKKRVESTRVAKVQQGGHHIGAQVARGEVALLINTVDASAQTAEDGFVLRREAVARGVPYFTTVEAARLAVAALEAQALGERQYRPLQDWLEAAR